MIEEQIERQHAVIQEKVAELESLTQEFFSVSRTFFKRIVSEFVKRGVKNNPEKIKELGTEGVKPIKDKLNEALSRADEYVGKALNNDALWVHRNLNLEIGDISFGQYSVHGNRGPENVEKAVRSLLAPAGKILTEHDLAEDDQWETRGGIDPGYKYGLRWSEEMFSIMRKFGEQFNEFYSLHEELAALKREKAENEAMNIWNKS